MRSRKEIEYRFKDVKDAIRVNAQFEDWDNCVWFNAQRSILAWVLEKPKYKFKGGKKKNG